jgi:hypothetical protein
MFIALSLIRFNGLFMGVSREHSRPMDSSLLSPQRASRSLVYNQTLSHPAWKNPI